MKECDHTDGSWFMLQMPNMSSSELFSLKIIQYYNPAKMALAPNALCQNSMPYALRFIVIFFSIKLHNDLCALRKHASLGRYSA